MNALLDDASVRRFRDGTSEKRTKKVCANVSYERCFKEILLYEMSEWSFRDIFWGKHKESFNNFSLETDLRKKLSIDVLKGRSEKRFVKGHKGSPWNCFRAQEETSWRHFAKVSERCFTKALCNAVYRKMFQDWTKGSSPKQSFTAFSWLHFAGAFQDFLWEHNREAHSE